jgi:Outer membrane protein beta-barrel domain
MRMKTKQRLLPAAAVLLFAGAVSSASGVGRFTLGVKGGLNSANLRVKSDITTSTFQTRNGFAWGGFIEYRISDLFAIQLEVLDSPKGSTLQQAISGTNYDTTLRYSYTEVPLLIKLAQGGGSRLAPSLYAGAYWAKLREATIRATNGRDDFIEELTDQRSTDLGLVFGLALDYDLGPFLLTGDIRYGLGLADVDQGAGSTLNHRVFTFLAGIGF